MARTSLIPSRTKGPPGYPADTRLNALVHVAVARQAAAFGELEHACYRYRAALESWATANESSGNRWRRQQERTNQEYASFLLGRLPANRDPI